ncbi:hypothetical protein T09_9355 [Trichinella sp. T9]|nr:hypothetical protein T09_9355 [Trichinella sp. T9]
MVNTAVGILLRALCAIQMRRSNYLLHCVIWSFRCFTATITL